MSDSSSGSLLHRASPAPRPEPDSRAAAARPLRTAQVARACGVHPNTVRLYESWGFIGPVPRAANGDRQYSPLHLDQMRLARLTMRCTWVSGEVRHTGLALIAHAAAGAIGAACADAVILRDLVRTEQAQAEAAVRVLERWARGERPDGAAVPPGPARPLSIGEAARLLGVTVDMLHNWERNGLLDVPRDPRNGYRQYGPAEIDRLRVIRALRRSRYSMMAILRMLLALQRGRRDDVRVLLDSPDEPDAVYVTDRWLSTLAELVQAADEIIAQTEAMRASYGESA
jgi:DNA-binding transcriptional MerR regulator